MSEIVNRGAPDLTLKRHITAEVTCPNCTNLMKLNADIIDLGHIISCDSCQKNTYYPFEKPWFRRRRLIVGYIVSICVAFIIGIASNYAFSKLNKSEISDDPELTQIQD